MKKKLLSVLLFSAMLLALTACGKKDDTSTVLLTQDSEGLLSGQYGVEIEIENYGTISLTLDADTAPVSTTNFFTFLHSGYPGQAINRP